MFPVRVHEIALNEIKKVQKTQKFCVLITIDIRNTFNTANQNLIKKNKDRNLSAKNNQKLFE